MFKRKTPTTIVLRSYGGFIRQSAALWESTVSFCLPTSFFILVMSNVCSSLYNRLTEADIALPIWFPLWSYHTLTNESMLDDYINCIYPTEIEKQVVEVLLQPQSLWTTPSLSMKKMYIIDYIDVLKKCLIITIILWRYCHNWYALYLNICNVQLNTGNMFLLNSTLFLKINIKNKEICKTGVSKSTS